MKVGIIHLYPFPIGMAATNRIIAYSKGLIADNASITVFCLNPYYRKEELSLEKNGVYEGINYHFFTNPYRAKNDFLHKLQLIYSIIKSFFSLALLLFNKEIDVLIISTEKRFLLKSYSHMTKIVGTTKTIFIFDEYPISIRYEYREETVNKERILYRKTLKYITAFVSINKKLIDFYNKELNKPYLIFPIITDVSKFPKIYAKEERKESLCYMGSLDLKKDNIDLIIRALAEIANKYPKLTFNIYGKASNKDYNTLKELIKKLKLNNKVRFKGVVSFDKVPQILSSSKILVSSQVNSMRVQGGLSTKLGEYLASGTPVLLSNVGDISNQVIENKHLYLVEPESVEKYAQKLSYILDNYDDALNIAKQGRDFIYQNYSHITMGKRLQDFLKQI